MAKKKFRLSDEEAEYLGLQKKYTKWHGNPQYYVDEAEIEKIHELRDSRRFVEVSRRYDKNGDLTSRTEKLQASIPPQPDNFEEYARTVCETTGQVWARYREKKPDFSAEFQTIIEDMKKHSPVYPVIKRKKIVDGHLLIIDPADIHINKFCQKHLAGAEYNSQIAVERALEGVRGIIDKASGFNIEKIYFVIGNDILNTDGVNGTTTKGTPQETDLHWFTAFRTAKDCYVKCLEYCAAVADVDVVHCASNHDLQSGTFLAETLAAWFRNAKNITFDISPVQDLRYYQYGKNMIAVRHRAPKKAASLPLLMAQEQPKIWCDTKFRYVYLHHIHHQEKENYKSGKDYIGANVTSLRSPSPADIWHKENDFINQVAIEGFIHSKGNGRVSHLTHYF